VVLHSTQRAILVLFAGELELLLLLIPGGGKSETADIFLSARHYTYINSPT
jgi:hypothetical protein